MDIYRKYKNNVHSDKPTIDKHFCESLFLLKYRTNKGEKELEFLEEIQKGKKTESKITSRDIIKVIESVEKHVTNDKELISKVVIQKVKTGVTSESKQSGCWANLAFLYRDNRDKEPHWYMYGFLRARFHLKHLQVESDNVVELGYSHYISIGDKVEKIKI